MFNFDGEYRRKPQQNLSGTSKKHGRNELIKQAQEERAQRQAERIFNSSLVKIQAMVRGWLARKQFHDYCRQLFDELKVNLKTFDQIDREAMSNLTRYFLHFFRSQQDVSRLTFILQLFINKKDTVMPWILADPLWTHRLKKLIDVCLTYGVHDSSTVSGSLRVTEIFLSPSQYNNKTLLQSILHYLVNTGYYNKLRLLIDYKIPPLIQETIKPPTEVAELLASFIRYPLELCNNNNDSKFKVDVLTSLSKEILMPEYSEPIQWFVLPVLSHPSFPFPFQQLLETLKISNYCNFPKIPWLLCSILKISQHHMDFENPSQMSLYLKSIKILFTSMYPHVTLAMSSVNNESEDSDTDMEPPRPVYVNETYKGVVKTILDLINSPSHVQHIVKYIESNPEPEYLMDVCQLSHSLLCSYKLAIHDYRLLYTLSFRPKFLSAVWGYVNSVSQVSLFSRGVPLIQVLSRGIHMTPDDKELIIPQLAVFCALFSLLLNTLHDSEIFDADKQGRQGCNLMPFTVDQLITMCHTLKEMCLGLVELAYPDIRVVTGGYAQAVADITPGGIPGTNDLQDWIHLFRVSVYLLRLLHVRDSRRQFCPPGLWLSDRGTFPVDRYLSDVSFRHLHVRPFQEGALSLTRAEDAKSKVPPLSTQEVRLLTILRELPFVMGFSQRVLILQHLIQGDKRQFFGETWNFLHSINVTIRRDYIYEDAFEKLSPENEPLIKNVIRVHLLNAAGLDEAGIDGGGIFREFLSELIKTSFDPNRGFFCLTRDNTLYPNPSVGLLVPNFQKHYYFIGRMLGKVIYENLLVELPLAGFFLSKLVGRGDYVDIHHLDSLDPVMYKNLLYLLSYEGDVTDLGLDFTVVQNDLGETKVTELKPNGSDIPVTASNRIEYIHCMADYRLNQQIRKQCHAFKQGLADVISLEWLAMFDPRELQTLISGASVPIDVQDLREHCDYSGGYHSDHPVIKLFWKVVSGMKDEEKAQLLKFVTSCSRPPLLGFKELHPPFCIHHGGTHDRLPTASTCMNLLKLPEFQEEELLRTRLLYAIKSSSGFELS